MSDMISKSNTESAIAKLREELKKAKDKSFAEPIITYLIKRCNEDNGLCEDVCQEHKTWEKCFSYVYKEARKLAKGQSQCAVRDNVVYEWAEDYYHKDDKAEEEEKARKEAERKKKEAERKAEKKATATVEKETTKATEPIAKPKPAKKSKEIEGQIDLFSLIGV